MTASTPSHDAHDTPDLPPAVEVPDLPGADRVPTGDRRTRDDREAAETGSETATPTQADPQDEPA
jgi:hypothetical protein